MRARSLAAGAGRRAHERAQRILAQRRESSTWRAAQAALEHRQVVSGDDLRAGRRSDTVFVFGSGASLNEIADAGWAAIAEHDTFGFNWFVHQRFVRCDFHLVRQISDSVSDDVLVPQIREYCDRLTNSPFFRETTILLQHEPRALGANLALALGLVPPRPIHPWRTARGPDPSPSWERGLVHGSSTLFDAVNAATLIGWTSIVLVGVDLYDRRYFWLPEGETRPLDAARGATADAVHTQAETGLADELGRWAELLAADGVELSVYNPRSLLAGVLPVRGGAGASMS